MPSAVLTGSEGEEKSISEMQKQMDTRDEFIPLACSDRALLQVIF